MGDSYATWAAGLLYAVATAMLVSRLRADQFAPSGRRTPLIFGALAGLLHLGHHWAISSAIGGPDLSFFSALSLVGLGMAGMSVLVGWFRPVETIGVVVFPLATVLLLFDHFLGNPHVSAVTGTWQIKLHVIIALLAYAVLSIAALVAIMLAAQETALRTHRIGAQMGVFPPLSLVEGLLFQLIGAGFILLTLTLVTGTLFVEDLFHQKLAHKTILSIAAWLMFGTLLFGRWRWGWRGRRAARLTLYGMGLLLLAFVGTKFVLEIVLQKPV